MEETTYVVLGGGYAGLHALKAIRKAWDKEGKGVLKLILIDKNDYHLRKVLLFKPAANEERITIPFSELLEQDVQLRCGEVIAVNADRRHVAIRTADGYDEKIRFDRLVIALGSTIRRPAAECGGYPLTSLDDAYAIRKAWRANMQRAAGERSPHVRKQLLTVVIAGAGISGIETAGELVHYMGKEAQQLGIAANELEIILCNAHDRLLGQISGKLSRRLEEELRKLGVRVLHNSAVVQVEGGAVELVNGKRVEAGLCLWTTGLQPNPLLQQLKLPLTAEGKLMVDASYRLQGHSSIYAIGDCAHIVDPKTGACDGNTCREAIAQAARLAKVLLADQHAQPAPVHEPALTAFCVSLGPGQAIVWFNKWELDMILSGKLSWRIRQYTWDSASLKE